PLCGSTRVRSVRWSAPGSRGCAEGMDTNTRPGPAPEPPVPATPPPTPVAQPSTRDGLLRLLALLSLLGASTVLYVLAGMAAMSAVATTGGALFATWQHRDGGRPH